MALSRSLFLVSLFASSLRKNPGGLRGESARSLAETRRRGTATFFAEFNFRAPASTRPSSLRRARAPTNACKLHEEREREGSARESKRGNRGPGKFTANSQDSGPPLSALLLLGGQSHPSPNSRGCQIARALTLPLPPTPPPRSPRPVSCRWHERQSRDCAVSLNYNDCEVTRGVYRVGWGWGGASGRRISVVRFDLRREI